MKVGNPRFCELTGLVNCVDCPFFAEGDSNNACYSKGGGCPTVHNYAEKCAIAEGRATEEKPEAVAPLAADATLRDRFAAEAMAAIISKSPFLSEPDSYDVYEKTAIGAYDYADAMMKARAK